MYPPLRLGVRARYLKGVLAGSLGDMRGRGRVMLGLGAKGGAVVYNYKLALKWVSEVHVHFLVALSRQMLRLVLQKRHWHCHLAEVYRHLHLPEVEGRCSRLHCFCRMWALLAA